MNLATLDKMAPVVVVVVVVRTDYLTNVFVDKRQQMHPILVPCVQGPEKYPKLIVEIMSCPRLKINCTVWTIGTSRCTTTGT